MEQLTLLLEDFPASPTAAQANASEKRTNAIYGQRCLEQYEKFPLVSSWAKMYAASLIGTGEWYSTRCVLSWKVMGIKSRPLLYLRAVSARHTEEKEFGLLPTPTAMQDDADPEKVDARNEKQLAMGNPKFILGLTQMAKRGLLPTPTAVQRDHPERVEKLKASGATDIYSRNNGENRPNSILDYMNFHGMLPTPNAMDWNTGTKPETYEARKQRHAEKGVHLQMTLRQMAVGILPTPTARDFKGDRTLTNGKNITQNGQEQPLSLEQRMRILTGNSEATSKTSQLNPQFVAEMMGFPENWTELPFLNGEPKV